MALNRYENHLYVLPEDDATRSIAVGFSDMSTDNIQVLKPTRGWPHLLQIFKDTYISELRRYQKMHIVLLIDFDNVFTERMQKFRLEIPIDVASRVYVIGANNEAEDLKVLAQRKLGKLGNILADECRTNTPHIWNHNLLLHNQPEIIRLNQTVRPFIF